MIARATLGTDGDEDIDLDILDVIEAMGAQFHEHQLDIMQWSWKLFCAKWTRLIQAMDRHRERTEQQRVEGEFAKLAAAHAQNFGA